MATYQILRWSEIPVGVKARDDEGSARAQLPARFQNAVDHVATATGRTETKVYLAGWTWSDALEREGTARAVADAVVDELETAHSSESMRELKTTLIERLGRHDGEGSTDRSAEAFAGPHRDGGHTT